MVGRYCSAHSRLAISEHMELRLPRRALWSLLSTACSAGSLSLSPSAARSWQYASTSVEVGPATVPVSLWLPKGLEADSLQPSEVYGYRIDIGRIAKRLGVGWLSWLPSRNCPLSVGDAATVHPLREGCCLVFAHGFLGSRFDMAHVCEVLAAHGFAVAAPELPESLAASFEPAAGVDRAAIVSAVRDYCGGTLSARRYGIFGQSAGAGTATMSTGTFELGRAAICGFRGYGGPDPLFVVASEGDGVIPLGYISAAVEASAASGAPITVFPSADAAFASAERRGALFFGPPESESAVRVEPPPNHLSFLYEGSNEAMVGLLSPLLPVARLLGVPVLDFDRYQVSRDSESTGRVFVPPLVRFFEQRC
eukprot:3589274-Prymnesium_polylepis.2